MSGSAMGSFFPSVTRLGGSDSRAMPNKCEQRCPMRSQLFVHRNPGQDIEDMVDLDGPLKPAHRSPAPHSIHWVLHLSRQPLG